MTNRVPEWFWRMAVYLGALVVIGLSLADTLSGQAMQGQPAPGQAAQESVRVSKGANIHAGPTTAAIVLVTVPRGTVLPMIERRNVWVLVKLSPELRKTATPMRWYKNEDRGWMHQSTVEPVKRQES